MHCILWQHSPFFVKWSRDFAPASPIEARNYITFTTCGPAHYPVDWKTYEMDELFIDNSARWCHVITRCTPSSRIKTWWIDFSLTIPLRTPIIPNKYFRIFAVRPTHTLLPWFWLIVWWRPSRYRSDHREIANFLKKKKDNNKDDNRHEICFSWGKKKWSWSNQDVIIQNPLPT